MTGTTRATADRNRAERLTDVIRQHADVVVGHDAVHPDRNDCGGVGGCALMRAECDVEREALDTLKVLARAGMKISGLAVSKP